MSEQAGNNGGSSNETPSKPKPKLNTGEGQNDSPSNKLPTGETHDRTNSPTGEGSDRSPMGETFAKSTMGETSDTPPTGDPSSTQRPSLPMGDHSPTQTPTSKLDPTQPPTELTYGPGAFGPHNHATSLGDQTTIVMQESQFKTLMDRVTHDMMNSLSAQMNQRFTEQQHTFDRTMTSAMETAHRGRTQTDYSTLGTTAQGRTRSDYDKAEYHGHFTDPNCHAQDHQPHSLRYADGATDRKYGNETGQGGGYGFNNETSSATRHPDGYAGSHGNAYDGQEELRNRTVWMVKNHSSRASLTPPSKQLFTAMKTMTRKTIGTSLADYPAWLRYINGILQASYLSCLTMAHPQTLPRTEAGWNILDSTIDQVSFTNATTSMEEGTIPFTDKFSTNKWIMTVFYTVVKMYPDILTTIYTILVNTLDESLRYLVENNEVTTTTFRAIYYGVMNHFVSSTDASKAARFKGWIEGHKYSINQPISTYDSILRQDADSINLLYDPTGHSKMIPDSLIKVQLIQKIRAATGQRYVATMDVIKHQKLTHAQFVQRLQEKYLEEKQMGRPESANSVGEDESREQANFSGKPPGPWMTAPKGQKPKGAGAYCWLFAKTGECKFGEKCKFKHISKDNLPAHDEVAHVVRLFNSIAKTEHGNTAALVRARRSASHWKKQFQKKNPPPPGNRPTGAPAGNTTYEDTVRDTPSAYAATATDHPEQTEEYDSESLTTSDPDTEGSECE